MFSGKVVLVTGSSTGYGVGIVTKFAKLGANVIITGLEVDKAEIEVVTQECQNFDPERKILSFAGDLTNESFVKEIVSTTIETFGKLDVLVNCAGIGSMCQITEDNAIPAFDKAMAVNCRAPFQLCHLFAPFLIETKGAIVNIASVIGIRPALGHTTYCMSKAALIMMSQCLALELGPKGVRVNNICPAFGRTKVMSRMNVDAETIEKVGERETNAYPLRRLTEPEDIANAAVFLASDNAAFITGTSLCVDGGGLWTTTF